MRTILTTAIADALGWQSEFSRSREDVGRQFGSPFVENFGFWKKRVGGRFHGYEDRMRPGDYSDDTQMTLMTARAIRADGSFDAEYFSKVELPAFVAYSRGAGSTVKEAAKRIQRTRVHWYSNFFAYKVRGIKTDYRDAGANGVAMRIAPHAMANLSSPEAGLIGVWQNAITTHGHPRAILGALVQYLCLHLATSGLDKAQFLDQLSSQVQELSVPEVNLHLQEWVRQWEQDGRSFSKEWSTTLGEFVDLTDAVRGALKAEGDQQFLRSIGAYAPVSKGSGTVTAAAALYFYLKYREAPYRGLRRLVNMLGTDTDTIAAMAGALWGTDPGCPDLPESLMAVQDRKYLDEVDGAAGRAPKLPGRAEVIEGFAESLIEAPVAQRIDHALFGSGFVTEAWDCTTLTNSLVHVRRIAWNFGQSMIFAVRTRVV